MGIISRETARNGLLGINIFIFIVSSISLGCILGLRYGGESVTDFLNQMPIPNHDVLNNISDVAMIASIVLLIISLIGCCGAYRVNKSCLLLYCAVILVGIIMEVAIVVVAYKYTTGDDIDDEVNNVLSKYATKHYTKDFTYTNGEFKIGDDTDTFMIDSLQIRLECCGIGNYTDYQLLDYTQWDSEYDIPTGNATTKQLAKAMVPPTCCKLQDKGVFPGNLESLEFVDIEACMTEATPETTNLNGCSGKMMEKMLQYDAVLLAGAIIMFLIMGLVFWFSCTLYTSKEEEYKEM